MEFILSKLLLFLIKPLFWGVLLLAFSIFYKRQLIRFRFLIGGILVLLFFSNAFIVGKVFNFYEAKYPSAQNYDVGILLGGFSSINKRNDEISFGAAGDRFFQTISLYKKGTIKYILISSGNANLSHVGPKEADLAFQYLKDLGIPDSVLIVENQSRNTLENARFSAAIVKEKLPNARVVVITSAWHIPRAKLNFSKYFKNYTNYYPANYIGKSEYDWSDFIIPSADAIGDWNILLKEWIGLIVDRFRS